MREFNSLEGWVKSNAQKHVDKMKKILKTDLTDTDIRWECEAQIDIISSLKEAWQKKLDYIKSVLTTLETEVLGTLLADSEKDEDISKHRFFSMQKLDKIFDKARQAFARWKISGKRLKEVFNKATSDETEVKDENAEEPDRRPDTLI